MSRKIHEIADDILADWKKPYYGAVPYIEAMSEINDIGDMYYLEPADSIVAYFLSNAGSWRGETARKAKAELKSLLRKHGWYKTTSQPVFLTQRNKEADGMWNNDQAYREGWGVFQVDDGRNVIQRLDDPQSVDESYPSEPVFDGDLTARRFVFEAALAGSNYHRQALELVLDLGTPRFIGKKKGVQT